MSRCVHQGPDLDIWIQIQAKLSSFDFSTGNDLCGQFFESEAKKEQAQSENICNNILFAGDGAHDYRYGACITGFITQLFVKALIHLNKYLIEPIMILTAMKQLIKPFHLP